MIFLENYRKTSKVDAEHEERVYVVSAGGRGRSNFRGRSRGGQSGRGKFCGNRREGAVRFQMRTKRNGPIMPLTPRFWHRQFCVSLLTTNV